MEILYGSKMDAPKLRRFLDHVFMANQDDDATRPTPVCVWGSHGLGKTDAVAQYAREHGWGFTYIAPAQFEEMGDLQGMPRIVDGQTVYAPPSWVPTEPGPGILLIDDINRADDRILRGMMQLLQNYELSGWSMPSRWQIVATANPDGGDYSVTTMDDAMLTRMLHVTLTFDARAWAQWATPAGVDPRGIAFVLTYPEIVTGKRTTPRSLVQFFGQTKKILDLKASCELVHALAASALDDVTVATFMSFVSDGLTELIDPADILNAKDFSIIHTRVEKLARGTEGAKRMDRLATICTRVYIAVTQKGYKPDANHGRNLVSFLLHDALPNDLRVSLHKDLLQDGSAEVIAMMRDKRLAELMLHGM